MLHKEIIVSDNIQPNEQELNDLIVGAVGTMALEDKENLVYLLQQSGSLVTEMNTQSEILDSAFKAIRDNENFRKNLNDYLVSQGEIVDLGESNFANLFGDTKVGAWLKTAGQNIGKGATKVGSAIFTKENTQAIIGAGIGILGSKLQAQAQRGSGQQAIDYTNAQANLEAIKLAQLQSSGGSGAGLGDSGTTEKKNKWVLPVAIGGGVLVLGTILFFALRKKNN